MRCCAKVQVTPLVFSHPSFLYLHRSRWNFVVSNTTLNTGNPKVPKALTKQPAFPSPINTEASSMDSNENGHSQGENQKHLAAGLEEKVKTQIVRI